jgi:hypothetical protein
VPVTYGRAASYDGSFLVTMRMMGLEEGGWTPRNEMIGKFISFEQFLEITLIVSPIVQVAFLPKVKFFVLLFILLSQLIILLFFVVIRFHLQPLNDVFLLFNSTLQSLQMLVLVGQVGPQLRHGGYFQLQLTACTLSALLKRTPQLIDDFCELAMLFLPLLELVVQILLFLDPSHFIQQSHLYLLSL